MAEAMWPKRQIRLRYWPSVTLTLEPNEALLQATLIGLSQQRHLPDDKSSGKFLQNGSMAGTQAQPVTQSDENAEPEYSNGEEGLIGSDDIKGILRTNLDAAESTSKFTLGKSHHESLNPTQNLERCGDIRFPLGPGEFHVIKEPSDQGVLSNAMIATLPSLGRNGRFRSRNEELETLLGIKYLGPF